MNWFKWEVSDKTSVIGFEYFDFYYKENVRKSNCHQIGEEKENSSYYNIPYIDCMPQTRIYVL